MNLSSRVELWWEIRLLAKWWSQTAAASPGSKRNESVTGQLLLYRLHSFGTRHTHQGALCDHGRSLLHSVEYFTVAFPVWAHSHLLISSDKLLLSDPQGQLMRPLIKGIVQSFLAPMGRRCVCALTFSAEPSDFYSGGTWDYKNVLPPILSMERRPTFNKTE